MCDMQVQKKKGDMSIIVFGWWKKDKIISGTTIENKHRKR